MIALIILEMFSLKGNFSEKLGEHSTTEQRVSSFPNSAVSSLSQTAPGIPDVK